MEAEKRLDFGVFWAAVVQWMAAVTRGLTNRMTAYEARLKELELSQEALDRRWLDLEQHVQETDVLTNVDVLERMIRESMAQVRKEAIDEMRQLKAENPPAWPSRLSTRRWWKFWS